MTLLEKVIAAARDYCKEAKKCAAQAQDPGEDTARHYNRGRAEALIEVATTLDFLAEAAQCEAGPDS